MIQNLLFALMLIGSADLGWGMVKVTISPERFSVDDMGELNITSFGELTKPIELPQVPGLEMVQQGTSSNMSFINGAVTRETSYNYAIVAEKPGTYTIPEFFVEVDKKTYRVKSTTIEVIGSAAEITDNSNMPTVFIERTFSNKEPYEQETIIATTRIFHRVQLAKASNVSEKFTDVRVETIGETEERKVIGDHTYQAIVLKQAMVPIKGGALEVPPFKVRVAIPSERRHRRGSPFDGFFGGFMGADLQEKTIASQPGHLQVKQLPAAGKPKDFRGIVGEFGVQADLSRTELTAGDTTTLSVTISGAGSLEPLGLIELQLPDGVKSYQDKPEIVEKPNARSGLVSKRVYKWALVPQKSGQIDLGDFKLPYFDPATQKYRTATTKLGQLEVAPGKAAEIAVARSPDLPGNGQTNVSTLGSDLVDIYRGDTLTDARWTAFEIYGYGGLVAIPGLTMVGLYLWAMSRRLFQRDPKSQRKYRALKNFRASLKSDSSVAEMLSSFRTFCGDRIGIIGTSLGHRELIERIEERDPKLATQLDETLTAIEKSVYGRDSSGLDVSETQNKILKLAQEIDRKC